jgi:hypothetical protein
VRICGAKENEKKAESSVGPTRSAISAIDRNIGFRSIWSFCVVSKVECAAMWLFQGFTALVESGTFTCLRHAMHTVEQQKFTQVHSSSLPSEALG